MIVSNSSLQSSELVAGTFKTTPCFLNEISEIIQFTIYGSSLLNIFDDSSTTMWTQWQEYKINTFNLCHYILIGVCKMIWWTVIITRNQAVKKVFA